MRISEFHNNNNNNNHRTDYFWEKKPLYPSKRDLFGSAWIDFGGMCVFAKTHTQIHMDKQLWTDDLVGDS